MSRQFCTEDLWNWTQLWQSSPPYVSDCLQLTLIYVPCAVFCLSCILFILTCRRWGGLPITRVPVCGVYLVKIMAHVLLAVLALVIVISKSAMEKDHLMDSIYILSAILQILSVVSSLIVLDIRRRMKRPACPILFMFWFVLSLSSLPRLYALCVADSGEDPVQFYLGVISYIVTVVTFVLVTHTGHTPTTSMVTTQHPCPEVGATVASKLTYWWLNRFVYRAYKRPITQEDVFNLRQEDSVEYNYNLVQRAWDLEEAAATSKQVSQRVNRGRHSRAISVNERTPLLMVAENGEAQPELRVVDSSGNSSSKPTVQRVSLFRVLTRVFGWDVLVIFFFHIVYDCFHYAQPFLLSQLLTFISTPEAPMWHGYLLAAMFLVLGLFAAVCINRCYYLSNMVGLRVRSSLITSIYRKSLKLSSESRGDYTTGEIVNLMSVDAERICDLMQECWYAVAFIAQLSIGLALLWQQLGAAIFVGIGILVVLIPLNAFLMAYSQTYQTQEMQWKDSRLKLLNEMLSGIKILKLYAWEPSFSAKIRRLRQSEVTYLGRSSYLWATVIVIWDMAPYLVLLSTFLMYVYSGGTAGANILTPARIFVSLSLFNMLRFPMTILPWGIAASVMAMVSIKRINEFLCQDDLDHTGINLTRSPRGEHAVTISRGSFSWKKEGQVTLQDVDISIRRGSLVAIVGKVGTGKSSLLSACMGEMVRLAGAVEMQGSVAYVSQVAWILNQSLRDNILFGGPMESAWYKRVVTACALQPDLDLLAAGDETEIGERGINLSGGQKQRVSLARAVYQRSDIYLLDDPLSAVDAHVGKHLFEHVIGPNGLLREKTRILVTHGFQWLPFVDEILVLNEEGRIGERGTYQELLNSRGQFMDFLLSFFHQTVTGGTADTTASVPANERTSQEEKDLLVLGDQESSQQLRAADILQRLASHDSGGATSQVSHSLHSHPMQEDTFVDDTLPTDGYSSHQTPKEEHLRSTITAAMSISRQLSGTITPLIDGEVRLHRRSQSMSRQGSMVSAHSRGPSQSAVAAHSRGPSMHSRSPSVVTTHGQKQLTTAGQLIDEEVAEVGKVSWRAYLDYFSARSVLLTLITVGAYTGFTGFQIWSNIWLQQMADDKMIKNASDHLEMNETTEIRNEWLSVVRAQTDHYMITYGSIGIGEMVFVIVFAFIGARANIQASKVLHSQLLDRILRAPMSFFDTTPTGRIVNRFSRDIETVDHSMPNALNDTIACAAMVIASFLVISISTPLFISLVVPLLIIYLMVQKFYLPTSRQARRLESVTRSPIFTNFSETIAGSMVIRAFRQKERFVVNADKLVDTNARFYFLKWSSNRWLGIFLELVGNLVIFASVMFALNERSTISAAVVGLSISYALQITENLNWLVRQTTELETNSVSLERIKEYSTVEQEASWDEGHGPQPDGDWPRSGQVDFVKYNTRYRSGLPLCLRDINLTIQNGERVGIVGRTGAGKSSLTLAMFRIIEAASGHIMVDGVRLDSLGLHQLRRRLTILPQDPVIFCGSLRDNLDPFGVHTDSGLWEALERAHLGEWARGLAERMDYECGESGANLSVGQRQLLCLARALLRHTKLLILDEATAAVDVDTDRLVMRTIREEFNDSTVIIIAHRLPTIMDADKVLVLDQGQVHEFGPPAQLMRDRNSVFHGLCQNAGLLPADLLHTGE